jgi:hypothetical protein
VGCLAVMLLIGAVTAHAQQPAARGVVVRATVGSGPAEGITCFSYALTNPQTSTGAVANFAVDVSRQPGTGPVSDSGIVDGPGAASNVTAHVRADANATPTIAVGLSAPSNWDAALSTQGTASWIASRRLVPGETLAGFQICSRGLVGLRRFSARASVDIDSVSLVPPDGTAADMQRYKRELDGILANVGTTGITVGPIGPPAAFDPAQFIERLRRDLDEAVKQGWVQNNLFANSFRAKLDAALAAVRRGNVSASANILKALLNEVRAQTGKQLGYEAAALLKFNTEYLLEQLR